VGLRLVFLLARRLLAWARLSRRQESWKSAEILLLRHQLTVLQRQVATRPRPTWADRALIALLFEVIPKSHRAGCDCS
jgi:putative transposase